jgi:hypothetical protein
MTFLLIIFLFKLKIRRMMILIILETLENWKMSIRIIWMLKMMIWNENCVKSIFNGFFNFLFPLLPLYFLLKKKKSEFRFKFFLFIFWVLILIE